MRKGLTELVFILDRSGSMSGLESDTIGGYNALLEKQKKEAGEAIITTVLFDDKYELLHDRISLKGVKAITDKDYFVRGTTALLDAIGKTINKIGNAQKHTAENEQAEHVLFVITTDGLENSSREFNLKTVRQLVERQKEKYGWEFLFLGANIDAIDTAGQFGIAKERAVNYHADSEGTELNYEILSKAVSRFRTSHSVSEDWKDEIDADFKKRSTKK
ncbi:MAG: VWA domain-containing protein [Clostridiales bacterium]|nr:VWA domain-containing protein [Clostridiales bacterium]